jgi:hypothetical protein
MSGPDVEMMIALISQEWPDAVVATIEGAAFFSLDESNWPNFATVVWSDDFDEGTPSELSRPGAYRVNVGVGQETFARLVGEVEAPDYTAFDRWLPHPVYGRQNWVSILNPSETTVRSTVLPLIGEAHDRLMARRRRRAASQAIDHPSSFDE